MTRFGPRIEPITSRTLGRCATSYATDAGQTQYLDLHFMFGGGEMFDFEVLINFQLLSINTKPSCIIKM